MNDLKSLFVSEKKHSADLEKRLTDSLECGAESQKKLDDSDNKNQQLQDILTRLEDKLQNLESESKVFRQQAVAMAPNKSLLESAKHSYTQGHTAAAKDRNTKAQSPTDPCKARAATNYYTRMFQQVLDI